VKVKLHDHAQTSAFAPVIAVRGRGLFMVLADIVVTIPIATVIFGEKPLYLFVDTFDVGFRIPLLLHAGQELGIVVSQVFQNHGKITSFINIFLAQTQSLGSLVMGVPLLGLAVISILTLKP
jgi:hypothetical protein